MCGQIDCLPECKLGSVSARYRVLYPHTGQRGRWAKLHTSAVMLERLKNTKPGSRSRVVGRGGACTNAQMVHCHTQTTTWSPIPPSAFIIIVDKVLATCSRPRRRSTVSPRLMAKRMAPVKAWPTSKYNSRVAASVDHNHGA
eukprot:scaffold274399_cov37-Tisochrysis_lutea.AAC.6